MANEQQTIKALCVEQAAGGGQKVAIKEFAWEDLIQGEVTIRVHYSSVNYKDALGVSGRGRIFKKLPIIPGIDAAGVVAASVDERFQVGQHVIVTGCGLGETQHGGFSEYISVPAAAVVALPTGLSLREAMALGTAGFTAALCVQRLQDNGQTPEHGPFVVTGATGGVGSFAVAIMAELGYEVVAVSGKTTSERYLKSLGAGQVISPEALLAGGRPLESVRFGGAIDNVGGKALQALLPQIQLWGNVASVGLAESAELSTTVMPQILRGVSLLGISSNNCPAPLRHKLWQRLAAELKPRQLEQIACHETTLAGLPEVCQELMDRQVVGRYIVDCRRV